MANKQFKSVHIKVHQSFYDNIFEPERKRLSTKLGINQLTQSKFTEYLVKSGAKIYYPNKDNSFAPKRNRRGGYLSL